MHSVSVQLLRDATVLTVSTPFENSKALLRLLVALSWKPLLNKKLHIQLEALVK